MGQVSDYECGTGNNLIGGRFVFGSVVASFGWGDFGTTSLHQATRS